MSKKAQVTIFFIVAIVIVAAVALFFLFRLEKSPFTPSAVETNPQAFMSNCIEEEMRTNINLVLSQGGFIEPLKYHLFDNNKVTYLCYNPGSYAPCTNQHPMFIQEISKELNAEITPVIEQCFNEFETALTKQGYEISIGEYLDTSISLTLNKVFVDITKDLEITKNQETSTLNDMRLTYLSSLYNLASIANEIANGESEYCHFEARGFNILNPEYSVLVKKMSDSTKIYSIEDEKTKEKMYVATRGCAQ